MKELACKTLDAVLSSPTVDHRSKELPEVEKLRGRPNGANIAASPPAFPQCLPLDGVPHPSLAAKPPRSTVWQDPHSHGAQTGRGPTAPTKSELHERRSGRDEQACEQSRAVSRRVGLGGRGPSRTRIVYQFVALEQVKLRD